MSITFQCPEAPSTNRHGCNFANGNALDLLQMLGLLDKTDPWYGCWEVGDLPDVQRAIMRALNIDGDRVHLISAPRVDQSAQRATAIYQGNTDGQTLRRLADLQKLVAYAAENKYRIVYN